MKISEEISYQLYINIDFQNFCFSVFIKENLLISPFCKMIHAYLSKFMSILGLGVYKWLLQFVSLIVSFHSDLL